MDEHCVVVGIGNPYLQDDRAGVVIVEELERAALACRTEVLYTVGPEVMDRIRGFRRAIIIDACLLGNAPGTILELGLDDLCTTHSLTNSHAITLGATLKTGYLCFPEEMPADLRIILIEVKAISEFTEEMSPEVEAAAAEVVARIRRMVAGPA
ncbi:MAG: hydrogenase maturation protease [Desulfobulbus sp.]|jgi:hydrogenase maturation protease|nr:hydrogenase maturation protease [Desulfobulbus sp.]